MEGTTNVNKTLNDESYHIEEVDSDDESKKKGLCVEKRNKIVINLSRCKRKLEESDSGLEISSKRRSLNKSDEFNVSIYKNLNELINKYDDKTDHNTSGGRTTSVHNSLNRSTTRCLNRSSEKSLNRSLDKSLNKSAGDSSFLSKKSSLVSHSTPKVQSKAHNNYKTIENFSPFKVTKQTSLPLKSISQNIDTLQSPILSKPKVQTKNKKKKSKGRTLFNSTNRNFDENQPLAHTSPVKALSQTISTPESPVSVVKLKKQMIRTPNDFRQKKFSSTIRIDPLKTPTKTNDLPGQTIESDIKLTPLKSQIISQVQSPNKGQSRVIESRCFMKWSKKMNKQVLQHNLIKMNASKNSNSQLKNALIYRLMDVIYDRKEEQANFLSLNKIEDFQRRSLFIRLTKVRATSGGFMCCDCVIDLERSTEVILFKYDKLKTLIPTHYANEFKLRNQAILEFVSPWSVFNCEKLSTSFLMTPFWIHILDHGQDEDMSEYECEYDNLNSKEPL